MYSVAYLTFLKKGTRKFANYTVDKAALLEAGAAKVELVADDEQLPEAVSSSLFEKFDSRRIRETYEDFCREKQIEDVSMGLEYLSRIENRSCGN